VVRRALYAILLAAMIVGGFRPFFLRIFTTDRGAHAAALREGPDRAFPGYAAFISGARDRIPPDARVAIVVPMRRWNAGYEYAYYRASYILTGREVIPLVDRDDTAHLGRVRGADFVAVWNMDAQIPGFAPLWSHERGVLLGRAR
jgi:hypothetical protein